MKINSLEAIARALQEAGARYLVAGGVAVVAHGYARLTFDLDLVVRLERENVLHALRALAGLGYKPHVALRLEDFADDEQRRRWRREKKMLVLNLISDLHRETPVDIFAEEPFDFEAAWKESAEESVAPGVRMRIVGLRTLIDMKETAGRERDRDDVSHLRKLLRDAPS